MTYLYWENFFQQWKAGAKAINGWTDPDSLPLPLYNSDNKDLSSLYVPEPWWGNDGSSPLHSVVINLNPGAGEDPQTINSINAHNFQSYAALVNSCYLPKTIAWHLGYRVEPILNALNRGGYISKKDISLKSHLSIELIPWHTQSADTTYLKYYINYEGIYIVRVDEIAEESFKYCNPYVIVKATVLNTLSGNEIDNIEFKINEVIVSIEDYEKETGDYDKYSNYSSYNKDSSYVIVTNDSNLVNASYPEVGKKYITSIYCDKGKYYVDNSAKYSFYEVDEEENNVNINNEWKSIEL